MLLVYAAGPLANLVVAVTLAPPAEVGHELLRGPAPATLFWLWNVGALGNLIPNGFRPRPGRRLTDGAQLLTFLFASRERVDALLARAYALEGALRLRASDVAGAAEWYRRGLAVFP